MFLLVLACVLIVLPLINFSFFDRFLQSSAIPMHLCKHTHTHVSLAKLLMPLSFCAPFVSQESLRRALSVCIFFHWLFFWRASPGESWHKLFKRHVVPKSLHTSRQHAATAGGQDNTWIYVLSIPFLASIHLQRALVLTDNRIKVREAGNSFRNRWIPKTQTGVAR